MTVKQAAELLGVTKYRVHALIKHDQLASELIQPDVGTRYRLLKRADVERLAEERRKIAAGELPARGGTKPRVPPPAVRASEEQE